MADEPKPTQTDDRTSAEYDWHADQRRALEALLELTNDVIAPKEAVLEQELRNSCASADAALAKSQSEIESQYQSKCSTAEQTCHELLEGANARYASEMAEVKKRVAASRQRFRSQAREVERQARLEREDNLLMAGTVLQSTLEGLRQEFGQLDKKLTARRRRLDALQTDATQVLAQLRYEPPADTPAESPATAGGDKEDPSATYDRHLKAAEMRLEAMRRLSMPSLLIGAGPFFLLTLLTIIPPAALALAKLQNIANAPPLLPWVPSVFGLTLVIALLLGRVFRRRARTRLDACILAELEPFRAALAAGRVAVNQHRQLAVDQLRRDEAKTQTRHDQEIEGIQTGYAKLVADTRKRQAESLTKVRATIAQQRAEIRQRRDQMLSEAQAQIDRRNKRYEEGRASEQAAAQERYDRQTETYRTRHSAERAKLESDWQTKLASVQRLLEEMERLRDLPQVDWAAGLPDDWQPPQKFKALIPFGHWKVDLDQMAPSVRALAPFLTNCPSQLVVPALLAIPDRCSLLLQTERTGRLEAINVLRAVMLRLLTSLPPGRVLFTILDPVGLGESFAGFMHLVDYEEKLVGGRIWTESEHIEARLAELTSHMENVIQKYLRNEFASIDEYNAQAGELVEPYRFLVIADFPANFTENSARRLASIISSGARCGVFTLIAHDQRQTASHEIPLEDLTSTSIHLVHDGKQFVFQDEVLKRLPFSVVSPPPEDVLTRILQLVGHHAKDSLQVKVPFETIVPSPEEMWSRDSRGDIRVPLGHTGAVRQQQLRLGRGMAQHALIAGKTGSGKSTLLHVIVTNLALWYGPEEIEFYLVDFKKGVEFKTYVTNHLPHARAIAIESDREFGLSVLQRLDAELARRGDLFRAAGVQDLAGYRDTTGETIPRTLLIVDEFQMFFSEDDRLAQEATVLLDRLVRQGRAFGIHVLLGSQTLSGSASLPRSTMGQMAVRIALQCSEADSQLILDDTNVAARLLSRPGEALYNDAGGLVEGNSPFQTAWLSDDQRQVFLERVAERTRESNIGVEPPIVFEGNAPADIRDNRLLARTLHTPASANGAPHVWLGAPVAIKEPTHVVLKRQSGANLLLVGQRADAAAALLGSTVLSLAAQSNHGARFYILDGAAADESNGLLRQLANVLPHDTHLVAWRDVATTITEIADEVQRRLDADDMTAPAIYLLINGLQRYRMLRHEEETFSFSDDADSAPSADKRFAELLRDGPTFGVHVFAWSETLTTLERTLERQTVGEFDHRVLFQMSATDSANLIDTPEANKLGLYRALLYSEESGLMEKFRPYAAFDEQWLADVSTQLRSERS